MKIHLYCNQFQIFVFLIFVLKFVVFCKACIYFLGSIYILVKNENTYQSLCKAVKALTLLKTKTNSAMCKSRLEFQYCCFIICCFFCMLLYQIYDSLSSDNVVLHIQTQMDIHIMQEMEQQTIPSNINQFVSNTDNLTILIGLSPHKCGSIYFHDLLKQSFDILKYHYIENDKIEMRYWDRCMIPYYNYFESDSSHNLNSKKDDGGCNFNGYLSKFLEASNTNDLDTNNKYILFEHTPSYIRYYHSCYLLSHYSKLYNINFYVSFRNPSLRTWYEYWMHFNYKWSYNKTVDVNKMIEHINDDIDSFPKTYPKYQKLLNYIKIDDDNNNTSNVSSNDDIDEEKVVDLWIDATYDLFNNVDYNTFSSKQAINDMIEGKSSAFNVPPFAVSCYYPQVLMWYHTFANQSVSLGEKFKIFQFEWIHQDDGPRKIIQQLLIWIEKGNLGTKMDYIRLLNQFYQHKLNAEFHENVIQFTDNQLNDKLDQLYNDCNIRLYRFLKQHPELLLLTDRTFQF